GDPGPAAPPLGTGPPRGRGGPVLWSLVRGPGRVPVPWSPRWSRSRGPPGGPGPVVPPVVPPRGDHPVGREGPSGSGPGPGPWTTGALTISAHAWIIGAWPDSGSPDARSSPNANDAWSTAAAPATASRSTCSAAGTRSTGTASAPPPAAAGTAATAGHPASTPRSCGELHL